MKSDIKTLVESDPDFIDSKKYKYSLARYKQSHPGKTPDRQIAHMISKTEQELIDIYNGIIKKARQMFRLDI